MSDAYEHGLQAEIDRQKDLRREALDAEWTGAQGAYAGVIRQLRHRGTEATRRARWLLRSLAIVILLGLAFYLGQPFVRLWVDGERIALSRQLEETKTSAVALREAMDTERQSFEAALADSLEVVDTPTKHRLLGHVKIADGLLFYGEDGTLFRTGPDGENASERIETPNAAGLTGHVKTADGLLFYGEVGTLFRTGPNGENASALIETPKNDHLLGHVKIADGLLFYGENDALWRGPDQVRERFKGRAKDALADFPGAGVAETLQNVAYVDQSLTLMGAFRDELADDAQPHLVQRVADFVRVEDSLKTQADALRKQHNGPAEDLANFRQFPFSLIWERQAKAFEDFMDTCRGTDPSADLTTACLGGWTAKQEAEAQNWWQTLAVQVPPGVLLLFLLATLGGLYRYSLRVAGFYHSRADALELLTQGLSAEDVARLESMAGSLAADKVEFGRAANPATQAVDLMRAVRGTT